MDSSLFVFASGISVVRKFFFFFFFFFFFVRLPICFFFFKFHHRGFGIVCSSEFSITG